MWMKYYLIDRGPSQQFPQLKQWQKQAWKHLGLNQIQFCNPGRPAPKVMNLVQTWIFSGFHFAAALVTYTATKAFHKLNLKKKQL